MSEEILLDSQIRCWVFLPLLFLSLLEGLLSHYIVILLGSTKQMPLKEKEEVEAITRAKLLRENGFLLTRNAFLTRRNFFNNVTNGYFVEKNKNAKPQAMTNLMKDPSFVNDLLKGNITKIIPMLIGGGWINWMFSGFITTKLPFALALSFKPMLQRGIQLESLSSSWVSSVSWYFLNVFGIRSIYSLILNPEETFENELTSMPNTVEMSTSGEHISAAFKAEWEALEILDYKWILDDIISDFLRNRKHLDTKKN